MKYTLDAYEITKSPIKGLYKSPVVWGTCKGCSMQIPLVILKKPKHLSDKSFRKIVESLVLHLPKDIKIESKDRE